MARRYSHILVLATATTLTLSGCSSLKDSIARALDDDEDGYVEDTSGVNNVSDLTPSLAGWESVADEARITIGFGHTGFGLRAWFDDGLAPHISASAPGHQPTMAGTWSGEWGALIDRVPASGDARVEVTIDASATEAVLEYDDVPGFGDLATGEMLVSNGAFQGTHTVVTGAVGSFQIRGQFGGSDQAGVVGYVHGQDFLSSFYGERP